MLRVVNFIRRLAGLILSSSTPLEDVPKLLKAMAEYLQSEPDENFTVSEKHALPLDMSEEAVKNLERKEAILVKEGLLESDPYLSGTGKAGMDTVNFIYILSQVLVRIASVIMFKTFGRQNIQNDVDMCLKNLISIWGVDQLHRLNMMGLTDKYSGKSIKETKNDIINKLQKSSELTENFISSIKVRS